jgi:hypothetical protein
MHGLLMIGRLFYPSNSASVFGHAIALQSAIDSICFQMLTHAITISRVIFSDYQPKCIPQLGPWNLPQISITS